MTIQRPTALQPLLDRLNLPDDLAYDPKWSATPDFLERIADHALAAQPKNILECSSGVTTAILAKCCAQLGHGHVYSLENGPEFAAATRSQIARLGLTDHATVIDAPLISMTFGEQTFQWYSLAGLAINEIDMLVIDGPPGFIQPHSRYPALPALHARLNQYCAIFLDDAARADEREIVERWLAEYPEFRHCYVELERGCSELHHATGD